MKKLNTLILIAVSFFFSGCGRLPTLTYFQVDPYAKPFHKSVEVPLTIVLLEDVKDSLAVGTDGMLTVTEFRKSVAASLKLTVKENFESAIIMNTKPDTGLSLVIYRIKPFWKLNGVSSSAYGTDGTTVSTSEPYISAAFQFESSLFLDGEKLQGADLTVYSDEQMSTVGQAHHVFKSGLLKMCETINREIFTDEVINRIAAPDHNLTDE